MKVLLLIFAIFAVANCAIDPKLRNRRHLISRTPKVTPDGKVIHPIHTGKYKSNVSPYIVGGGEATPHSRPFQVALDIDGLYFCGGTLISNEWVLTAGHCTTGATFIQTQLGAHNISAAESTQLLVLSTGPSNIITHQNYSALTLHNDVGLVRFPSPITLTPEIQPAPLPSATDADLAADVQVVVSGWGVTSDDPSASVNDVLKEATVPTVSNTDCAAYYGTLTVTDATICTSSASGDGTCFGDSGGPLTYDDGTGAVHRAVVSFVSSAGCESGNFDGYTRTTHQRDWITQQTGL